MPATHGPVSVLVGRFCESHGRSLLDNSLEPMLGVALEGASFINLYSRGDARKQAQKLPHPTDKLDEQSARLVAVNQNVNTVITGEINLRGERVPHFCRRARCSEREGDREVGSQGIEQAGDSEKPSATGGADPQSAGRLDAQVGAICRGQRRL